MVMWSVFFVFFGSSAAFFKSEKMALVISSGLFLLGLRDYKVLTDSLYYQLGAWDFAAITLL